MGEAAFKPDSPPGIGRTYWVFAVARQMMLLFEFDEEVMRHTLQCGAAEPCDPLIEKLLEGARVAVSRLSKGGDETSRVLGGGVENRWRTRLMPVQEFLWTQAKLDPTMKQLMKAAGVTEDEMRAVVVKLIGDSARFVQGTKAKRRMRE